MAERGYKLLESIERITDYNDLGELEAERLAKCIAIVRKSRSCACSSSGWIAAATQDDNRKATERFN